MIPYNYGQEYKNIIAVLETSFNIKAKIIYLQKPFI